MGKVVIEVVEGIVASTCLIGCDNGSCRSHCEVEMRGNERGSKGVLDSIVDWRKEGESDGEWSEESEKDVLKEKYNVLISVED